VLSVSGQQSRSQGRAPGLEPIVSQLITVDVGESQTIPGPSAIAVLEAIVGITGGSTNGVVTSWTYTEGPLSAEFAQQNGITNLGTFTSVGRYTITVVAQKGVLFNTNSIYVFVVDQGITNFNPAVSMTRPANGAEFTAPINLTLAADAQDKDGSVTNVVFYNGATPLWTSTVAPYTFTLTNAAATNYVFAAAATDNRGATNLSASVSAIVRESTTPILVPPLVSITTPTNDASFTAPVTFDLTAAASDSDGTITSVAFTDNDVTLSVDTTFPYSVSLSPTVGIHTIRATALDDDGLTSVATAFFTVLNPPNILPVATLTVPTNGAVYTAAADIPLEAIATDEDGTISFVRWFVNGAQIATDSTAPYTNVVLSLGVGSYVFVAQAIDNRSAVGTSTTNTITVNPPAGTPPVVSLTSPTNGQAFVAGATVTLTATATDAGTITNVAFWSSVTDPPTPGEETIVNDDAEGLAYTGSWTDNNGALNRNNGDEHYTQTTGASVSLTFTGTQVSWFGTKFSNRGNADVFIDDVLQTTVDEYNSTVLYQQELFTIGGLTNGSHTIKVVCKGTKNGSSTGYYVDLDFFQYSTEVAAGPVETLVASDTTSPYTQSWIPAANSYLIVARAYNNVGLVSTSTPPVLITVNPPIPPIVTLTLPTNGAAFVQGDNIALAAIASDQDGTVTNVVFMQFQPDAFITSDPSSPYSGTWTNAPAGSYALVAKAFDSSGLTTISPAINITIAPTPPQSVFVDAGPFRTATMSAYKNYFDSEYTDNAATFNAIVNAGTGPNMYNAQFFIDGTISMYEGTKDTNYINRALVWSETCVLRANITDSNGKKNWGGVWASPYTATPIAYQLEEIQGASAMSRVARIVMTDPDLRAVYGTRATAVYNFCRDHILAKHLVTRAGYSAYANWSQVTTSNTSDKPSILLRLVLDCKAISAVLGSSDASTYGWATKATELAEGIKDYNGKEARFLPWQGGLIWGHGKVWQSWTDIDTSHANRLPFVVIQGFEMGQTFTMTHVTGLANLLTLTLWDLSTTSPQFRNFLSGYNGPFLNRPAWNNGKIADGWSLLAGYDASAASAVKATVRAIYNGVSNPSLSYNDSHLARHALIGHLVRSVSLRESPPYATLTGIATGSGITGMLWTHVSGPSGWTIAKPTSAATTILFTSAAVGAHTFRLTVSSGSPDVSDDVGVTVVAAPAM